MKEQQTMSSCFARYLLDYCKLDFQKSLRSVQRYRKQRKQCSAQVGTRAISKKTQRIWQLRVVAGDLSREILQRFRGKQSAAVKSVVWAGAPVAQRYDDHEGGTVCSTAQNQA